MSANSSNPFSNYTNPYQSFGRTAVIDAPVSERSAFITRTYLHLAGAVAAFVALLVVWFSTGTAEKIAMQLFGARGNILGAIAIMGGFLVVSFVAERMAHSATSLATQYAGLGLYVTLESLIFCPLLFIVQKLEARGAKILEPAALITLALFGVLTAVVFATRKDFSFMRSFLIFGSIALFVVFLVAAFLGHPVGMLVLGAGIILMCGWILYDTSNVLHHYGLHQHVAASLALFASLATLFWYVIRFVMEMSSNSE